MNVLQQQPTTQEQQKLSSLSLQLFQAYIAATVLSNSEEEEEEEQQQQKSKLHDMNKLSVSRCPEEEQETNVQQEDETVKNYNDSTMDGIPKRDEEDEQQQIGCNESVDVDEYDNSSGAMPTESVDVKSYYNLDKAIHAWDKIGEITNEVAYSAMVKQAQIVCDAAKRDDRIRKENPTAGAGCDNSHTKRRKVHDHSSIDNNVVVSSSDDDDKDGNHDDESESTYEDLDDDEQRTTESAGMSSLSANEDTDDNDDVLARQVERMGRMTKYMTEIETLFSKFREEMEGIYANTE
jgi:hypothetical protein